jgi:carbonic anhydrase/acetyltransferase-like protein (isoleucine patch superfamily)
MFPGKTVLLKKGAHVGHGAIIHGGTLGENCLIGMNAVIMDDVVIGKECIVGALCFVPAQMVIEDRKIVVGNPAKVVKDVSDDMAAWKTEGTKLYQQLPQDCHDTLKPCEPLREVPGDRKPQKRDYFTWKSR